jgi:hypothetical protein
MIHEARHELLEVRREGTIAAALIMQARRDAAFGREIGDLLEARPADRPMVGLAEMRERIETRATAAGLTREPFRLCPNASGFSSAPARKASSICSAGVPCGA